MTCPRPIDGVPHWDMVRLSLIDCSEVAYDAPHAISRDRESMVAYEARSMLEEELKHMDGQR